MQTDIDHDCGRIDRGQPFSRSSTPTVITTHWRSTGEDNFCTERHHSRSILGILAGVVTNSAVIGIVVVIVASVAAWYGIRAIERVLERGVEAGVSAVKRQRKNARQNFPKDH